MTVGKAFPRPKFDPKQEFVVSKPFTYSGQGLVIGQLFDKTWSTERRLRQLYEQRYLRFLEGEPVPKEPAPKKVERRKLKAA